VCGVNKCLSCPTLPLQLSQRRDLVHSHTRFVKEISSALNSVMCSFGPAIGTNQAQIAMGRCFGVIK